MKLFQKPYFSTILELAQSCADLLQIFVKSRDNVFTCQRDTYLSRVAVLCTRAASLRERKKKKKKKSPPLTHHLMQVLAKTVTWWHSSLHTRDIQFSKVTWYRDRELCHYVTRLHLLDLPLMTSPCPQSCDVCPARASSYISFQKVVWMCDSRSWSVTLSCTSHAHRHLLSRSSLTLPFISAQHLLASFKDSVSPLPPMHFGSRTDLPTHYKSKCQGPSPLRSHIYHICSQNESSWSRMYYLGTKVVAFFVLFCFHGSRELYLCPIR